MWAPREPRHVRRWSLSIDFVNSHKSLSIHWISHPLRPTDVVCKPRRGITLEAGADVWTISLLEKNFLKKKKERKKSELASTICLVVFGYVYFIHILFYFFGNNLILFLNPNI